MSSMKVNDSYGFNILLALDQFINAILWGNPDEPISSRAYRGKMAGKKKWKIACRLIDGLFFWDRVTTGGGQKVKHCELSFVFFLYRKNLRWNDYYRNEYRELLEEIKSI